MYFKLFLLVTGILFMAPLIAGCAMPGKHQEEKSPYAKWPNGPSTDPGYFPIGVWAQNPILAPEYRKAGINFYCWVPGGPTRNQLDILRENGMRAVVLQDIQGLKYKDDPVIMAWMQMDEPDNAQKQKDGSWGPPVNPDVIIEKYMEMKNNDPTRPVFLNLGAALANEKSKNRGPNANPDDYYGYVKGADIISFDIYPIAYYPIAGKSDSESEDYMWYVAKGIDRLYEYSGNSKVVWNIIEASNVRSPDNKVTPRQLKSQVWMSIIHGSKGIVYFVHSFYPVTVPASLLNDSELLAAVTEVNRKVLSFAPIINSPDKEGMVTVISSKESVPISIMTKEYDGNIYVFSIGMRNESTSGSFEIKGMKGRHTIEVIDEGRTLEAVDGKFTDNFLPYEVHIYKTGK